MATSKNPPKPAEPAPEPELTLEEFALSRGQRINNGIDQGVIDAYLDDRKRRSEGAKS